MEAAIKSEFITILYFSFTKLGYYGVDCFKEITLYAYPRAAI